MFLSEHPCAHHLRCLMPKEAETHLASLRQGILPALTQTDLDLAHRHWFEQKKALAPGFMMAVENAHWWLTSQLLHDIHYCRTHPQESLVLAPSERWVTEEAEMRCNAHYVARKYELATRTVANWMQTMADLAPRETAGASLAQARAEFLAERAAQAFPDVSYVACDLRTTQRAADLQRGALGLLLRELLLAPAAGMEPVTLNDLSQIFRLPAATVSLAVEAYAHHRADQSPEAAVRSVVSTLTGMQPLSAAAKHRLRDLMAGCELVLNGGDLRAYLDQSNERYERKAARKGQGIEKFALGAAVAVMGLAGNQCEAPPLAFAEANGAKGCTPASTMVERAGRTAYGLLKDGPAAPLVQPAQMELWVMRGSRPAPAPSGRGQ